MKATHEIKLPFDSEIFKAMWKYYRDYLIDRHGINLCSCMENERLTKLFLYSEEDEERAILIIEFLVANNYRNMVCPSDKQIATPTDIEKGGAV